MENEGKYVAVANVSEAGAEANVYSVANVSAAGAAEGKVVNVGHEHEANVGEAGANVGEARHSFSLGNGDTAWSPCLFLHFPLAS